MRTVLLAWPLSALMMLGCAGTKPAAPPTAEFSDSTSSNGKAIVTPAKMLAGKVEKVNLDNRFVVLSFPVGQAPASEQRLSLYHRGLKVGEVKISGWRLDDDVVADVLSGDAEVGDEVRSQ